MSQEFALKVNGAVHRVCVEPDTPLLYVLRNDLGLKSAKFGCGLGQCGACTVIVDGRAVRSCQMMVGSVEGREVTTLEGLGTKGNLHPLQQAFLEEQAAQCGFCTSGMIVTAAALLRRNPNPSDAEIRAEMTGNLFNRPGQPYLGIGEGAQGPAAAAIANAIFDAVGVRMREIPFTPERIKAALAARIR